MTISEIIVAILVIIATVFTAATTSSIWRAPDALTRVNLLGTTVSCAVPILIVAKLIRDWTTSGFDANNLVRAIIAIAAVWIIAAVGSFVIGRSIYGVTVVDVKAGESTEDGSEPANF
ncbi:Na+/H+ antiporter subunit G [Corynebacterium halotolerans]|uniref:Na+/H+ antiporter subunit G n=1 Tax=Corynebacterium halotolerans TaxID=225326 RepID=UPI003CF2EEE2